MKIFVAWNSAKQIKKKINPDWTRVWYKYKPSLNNQPTGQTLWPVNSSHLPEDLPTTTRLGDLSTISLEPSLHITFNSCSKRKLFSEQTVWFLPSDILTCRSEMQYMWKIDHMECRCVHGFIASIPTIRLFYLLDCWLSPWAILPYLHRSGNHAPSHQVHVMKLWNLKSKGI